MIISRPTQNEYWNPPLIEQTPIEGKDFTKHTAWADQFFNTPPWTCPVCRSKIVYLCDYCVYCKVKHRRYTPRTGVV